jgi:hypothetical protein
MQEVLKTFRHRFLQVFFGAFALEALILVWLVKPDGGRRAGRGAGGY